MNREVELVDLISESDEVVGQATVAEVHRRRLLHRSVLVLLSDGERILMQRRAETKALRPGKLTVSACGHVRSGETYYHAAVRELREELGISCELEGQFSLRGPYDDDPEQIRVYAGVWGGELLCPAPEEIAELLWLRLDGLSHRLGDPALNLGATARLVLSEYLGRRQGSRRGGS